MQSSLLTTGGWGREGRLESKMVGTEAEYKLQKKNAYVGRDVWLFFSHRSILVPN